MLFKQPGPPLFAAPIYQLISIEDLGTQQLSGRSSFVRTSSSYALPPGASAPGPLSPATVVGSHNRPNQPSTPETTHAEIGGLARSTFVRAVQVCNTVEAVELSLPSGTRPDFSAWAGELEVTGSTTVGFDDRLQPSSSLRCGPRESPANTFLLGDPRMSLVLDPGSACFGLATNTRP